MIPPTPEPSSAFVRVGGVSAGRVIDYRRLDVCEDAGQLHGQWVVVATFEGQWHAWQVEAGGAVPQAVWRPPSQQAWSSSLTREAYIAGVERIRADIRDGEVYQANYCRILSTAVAWGDQHEAAAGLYATLARGNPAPFAAAVSIAPGDNWPGQWVVSASPELYVRVTDDRIVSAPIKGTAAPDSAMLDKDIAENIMITDLVRNDLSGIAVPGTVAVPELLGEHVHPGLVHLQSSVAATLSPELVWSQAMLREIIGATFPPGSVSGAPKRAALGVIAREEPEPRGPYCGAIGMIDFDRRVAELAVGIRTFWSPDLGSTLKFGTGAGITWGSDPVGEWEETELKAKRLVALASGRTLPS